MCKLDSCSPRDYIDWEEHVEHYIGDFPHTSFRLGAIIEKKIAGTLGMCWSTHVMATKGKFSWEDIKEYFRELLKIPPDYHRPTLEELVKKMEQESIDEISELVLAPVVDDHEIIGGVESKVVEEERIEAEDVHIPIVEELIEEIGDSCVLELEEENHESVRENVVIEEEGIVIDFMKSEEETATTDPLDRPIELQELEDHHWVWDDFIDQSHDEWYEHVGKQLFIIMGSCDGKMVTPEVNSEELWEILIQRGFKEQEELHEPSEAEPIYLTLF